MPSTSAEPGADHKIFWGTVLPLDDIFWTEHRPGDRWNCKCSLRQTNKPVTETPRPSGKHHDPQPGLRAKPGSEEVFSDDHVYYPSDCRVCPFNKGVGRLFASLIGKEKHCNNCKLMNKVICEDGHRSKKRTEFTKAGKNYSKEWECVYECKETGGYIAVENGHGESEKEQNIKSATPLADAGFSVELIKRQTIRVDSKKKHITTRDANVNDEKWEFKYTKDYINLAKSIGTKAGQAVAQGADVLLIDIVKTKKYGKYLVILGVKNAFKYNTQLQKVCVMIESNKFYIVERKDYKNGTYIDKIKKWLTM